jgi:hypothetical protein
MAEEFDLRRSRCALSCAPKPETKKRSHIASLFSFCLFAIDYALGLRSYQAGTDERSVEAVTAFVPISLLPLV